MIIGFADSVALTLASKGCNSGTVLYKEQREGLYVYVLKIEKLLIGNND